MNCSFTDDKIKAMKRKRFPLICTLLAACCFSLLLLAGCATAVSEAELTEDAYFLAVETVALKARDNAVTNLFLHLNQGTEAMVPAEYSFLVSKRENIPGLDGLLKKWSATVSEFAVTRYTEYSEFAESVIVTPLIGNPRDLLDAGIDSVSSFFRSQLEEQMIQAVYAETENLDTSAWESILVQYDAWTATRKLLLQEENPAIDENDKDGRKIAAKALIQAFFKYMEDSEVLFRTTPNPDLDSRTARILGLD